MEGGRLAYLIEDSATETAHETRLAWMDSSTSTGKKVTGTQRSISRQVVGVDIAVVDGGAL